MLDSRGKFKKGHKKIGGKKKGSRHLSVITRETLEEVIRESDKTHNQSLLRVFIEKARKNPHVLIAVMKKFIADKKELDAQITASDDLHITVSYKNKKKQESGKQAKRPDEVI